MAPINVPSRLQFPTDVHPAHDYMKTVKTSQYSEALIEVRQNGQMRKCSPITSEADMGSFVSCSMAAEHEQIRLRRRELVLQWFTKTQTLACRTSEVWPGVTCGIEEGERAVKAKFPREPEEKKSAVENDDVSDIFVSRATSLEFERDPSACRLEFKQEKKCCSEFFECQLKDTQIVWNDSPPLLVPLSVQETAHSTDVYDHNSQPTQKVDVSPAPSPVSEQMQSDEEKLFNEDTNQAKVKVDEELVMSLDLNPLIHKNVEAPNNKQRPRRHAVKKVKRNIWCVTQPESPPVYSKRKKTCEAAKPKKLRQRRGEAGEKTKPEFVETKRSRMPKTQSPSKGRKRKIPTSPVVEEPKDSGVSSASPGSGCGSGSSGSSSGSNSSGDASGGTGQSSVRQNAGRGNGGDDGEKGGKKPWWHLPSSEDDSGPEKDEDDKKGSDGGSQEKMEVDNPQQDGSCYSFLPGGVDNGEQCHSPGGANMSFTRPKVTVTLPDLQHACYCASSNCRNMNCKDVKEELDHRKTHKDCLQCERCKYLGSVIQQHANICRLPGCRVPECSIIRNGSGGKKNTRKPLLSKTPREPVHVQLRYEAAFMPQPFLPLPFSGFSYDGKVIFRNSSLFPETGSYFQEHIDYHVNRSVKLGEGSYGQVYQVYCQSNLSNKVVIKETNYAIKKEEVEIYKLLGDHHNIVKHYGGTFRGNNGFACIFMEKCEESLHDYMKKIPGGRLSVDEAMFNWPQVLDGLVYLHDLGVIHKDIKAKNVLIKEGRALLADFDSAKRIPSELTEPGLTPMGTRGFSAPEVLNSLPHGRPADVYNMGCFLIELTIGVPTWDTLKKKINELSRLDPELAKMVTACVSDNPKDRPTVRALLEYPVVKRYNSKR
ncbi:uncharacterized protein [Montipora foliosa]|uniref:uncharacterized protein n=1 Tax=Montipora foliosa TaxID=591990 RepID=UPI0035F125E7